MKKFILNTYYGIRQKFKPQGLDAAIQRIAEINVHEKFASITDDERLERGRLKHQYQRWLKPDRVSKVLWFLLDKDSRETWRINRRRGQ